MSPFLIGYFTFNAVPILFSFGLSFSKWDGFSSISFVGLKNYIRLLKDTRFFLSVFNTFFITAVGLPSIPPPARR